MVFGMCWVVAIRPILMMSQCTLPDDCDWMNQELITSFTRSHPYCEWRPGSSANAAAVLPSPVPVGFLSVSSIFWQGVFRIQQMLLGFFGGFPVDVVISLILLLDTDHFGAWGNVSCMLYAAISLRFWGAPHKGIKSTLGQSLGLEAGRVGRWNTRPELVGGTLMLTHMVKDLNEQLGLEYTVWWPNTLRCHTYYAVCCLCYCCCLCCCSFNSF